MKEILKVRPDFAWKRDINGCTPLHISCSKGHLDITRELLKLDADFCTLQDCHGRTPLHLAAIKGRVNIIDEILSWSLEFAELITKNGDTILHLAVKNNQYDTIKYLIERLNITKLANFPDSDGNTILHLATAGKLTAVSSLIITLFFFIFFKTENSNRSIKLVHTSWVHFNSKSFFFLLRAWNFLHDLYNMHCVFCLKSFLFSLSSWLTLWFLTWNTSPSIEILAAQLEWTLTSLWIVGLLLLYA